jgi:rod shape-determining protein MreC
MESFLGRYRNLIILVGVLFLQMLGLAVQVKRSNDAANTRLIRIWAVDLITPLERVLVWSQNGTGNLWHNYLYLRGVRAENRDLKQQIENLRLEQVRLSEDAAQAHRLQALLAFKATFVSKTLGAQVIGTSGSDLSRIVYIDKGSDQGVRQDMAVITSNGIVGKVWEVYPSVAKVLLINDQSSGVGVLLDKSRLQGVLRGSAIGEVVLERVMSDEEVSAGENVETSGGDQIFPKGLPVGTVMKVSAGKDLFLNIKIKPAANLNKLEEVLVVTEKQERQPIAAQDTVRMRASDILSQRLPSVPEKPPIPDPSVAKAGSLASGSPATSTSSGTPKQQPQTGAATSTAAKPNTVKPASSVGATVVDPSKPRTQPVTSNDASTKQGGNSQSVPAGSQPAKPQVPKASSTKSANPAQQKPPQTNPPADTAADGPH